MYSARARSASARFSARAFNDGRFFVNLFEGRDGIVGDLADHFVGVESELHAFDVADSRVEGAEDQFGALEFDGAAEQGVDDFHQGGLDGLLVLSRAW